MRNLKRALSLAVASVMLMSMMVVGAGAVDFKDADDITNIAAATVLEALEIMIGDDAGNFNPDQVVTRAEMATILCRVYYGADVDTSNSVGVAMFTDVDGHWAEGAIGMAASAGWINGRGDGTFDPDATVSTYEAALMLQRALGYFAVNDKTDYSDSLALYAISLANQLKIFDGVSASTYAGLTRDEVAVAAYNVMFSCAKVAYSTFTELYYAVDIPAGDVSVLSPNVSIDFGTEGTFAYDVHEVTITDGVDYMGRPVDVVNVDGDELATSPITPEATITSNTDRDDIDDEGDEIIEDADELYFNGEEMTYAEFCTEVFGDADPDDDDESLKGITIEVYNFDSNESDAEYTYYVAYNYIVDEIDDLDYDDDDDITTIKMDDFSGKIYADGDLTELFDEGDMVMFTYGLEDNTSGDDKYIDTIVIAVPVEGEITAVSNTNSYVKLDGTSYYINKYATVGGDGLDLTDNDLVEDTYALYLDANGYIVYAEEIESTTESGNYLLVTGISDVYSNGDYTIKAILSDGTEIVADLDDVDMLDNSGVPTLATIYEYSLDGDDYDITEVDTDISTSVKVETNYAVFTGAISNNMTGIFTDDTVFVDEENGTWYEGFESVPDYSADTAYTFTEDGEVVIVFLMDGDTDGSTGTYVYFEDDDYYVTTIDGTKYYVYEDAYIDGVNVEVYSEVNMGASEGDIFDVTMDENDYVTAYSAADLTAEVTLSYVGSATVYTTSDINSDGYVRYEFDDDTIFVLVDHDAEEVSVGDAGDMIKFAADSDYTTISFEADGDYLEYVFIYLYEV